MSTFPSVLTAYTNPNPTDRLNAPSHSSIESAQNSGISQLEAVVGIAGASSVVGTYEYFVKSPASNGGGHVQTANKGGTGQTSYTKGDILVAQSSSVLTKLAVGTDTYVLTADSTKATGVTWTPLTPLIGFDTTMTSLLASTTETTIYSSVLGSGFFTANTGLKIKANYKTFWTTNNAPVVTVNVKYNSSTVGTVNLTTSAPGGDNTVRTYAGTWESVTVNGNNLATQRSVTNVMGILQENSNVNVANLRYSDVRNSVIGATVDTSGQVTLAVTYQSGANATGTGWEHDSITVEKLVKISP